MDEFSDYNQIRIDECNQEHTTFITKQKLYCYKVMSFGSKNVRATYQRLIIHMFKPIISKTIEVHVNDMITKSL